MKLCFRAPVIDTRSETIPPCLLPRQKLIAPALVIENKIHLVRGQKVMLDSDLAELYEVPTKRLNEAVRRNLDSFPEDFSFLLTDQELAVLRSQFVTASFRDGGRRYGV